MARNNTRLNLDIVVGSIGATLGGGSTTERKFSWTGAGDMTLFSQTTATYRVPNLTGSPTPPSSIADTLIGYSSYSPTSSGNFTGALLYGGPLTPPSTNVAPSLLAIGAPGQVLEMSGSTPQWVTAPPSTLTVTTWSAAIATQATTAGVGYYVPASVSATFTLTAASANTHVAIYAAGIPSTPSSWTINLASTGQTVQFGNISATNNITSSSTGDGVWMISLGSNKWLVVFAAGNPSYS